MAVMEGCQAARKRTDIALLVLITIMGTGLRIYRLDYQSLWYDEILTFFSSHGTLAHVLFQTEFKTNILPFYYLVTHAFLALGEQEVFVRMPAVIFGALTIPLFYYSVRHWFGFHVGLWSSSLLAISPFHIFYSQEARPYTMFVFLCLLTFYLLQVSIENKENRWLKLSVAIVGASTFYCHTTAIPFLGFLGLCIVILVPQDEWRKWIPTFLGMGLLLLPALYRANTIQVTLQGWQDFDPLSLLSSLWAFSAGFSFGVQDLAMYLPESLNSIAQDFLLMALILTFTASLALYGAWKAFQNQKIPTLIFILFFVSPIIFMSLAAIGTSRPFHVRHIIPSLLPFFVFLALGLVNVQKKYVQLFCVGIFLCISAISLNNYYFDEKYFREDNRGAVNFLASHSSENDLVICMEPWTPTSLLHYLPPTKFLTLIPFRTKSKVLTAEQLPVEMQERMAGHDRFWVYYTGSINGGPKGPMEQHFDENYVSRHEFYSSKVKLIQYEIVKDP